MKNKCSKCEFQDTCGSDYKHYVCEDHCKHYENEAVCDECKADSKCKYEWKGYSGFGTK